MKTKSSNKQSFLLAGLFVVLRDLKIAENRCLRDLGTLKPQLQACSTAGIRDVQEPDPIPPRRQRVSKTHFRQKSLLPCLKSLAQHFPHTHPNHPLPLSLSHSKQTTQHIAQQQSNHLSAQASTPHAHTRKQSKAEQKIRIEQNPSCLTAIPAQGSALHPPRVRA